MILVINNNSKYVKTLNNLLRKNKVRFTIKDQRGFIDNIKGISGVILSGGGPNLDRKIDISSIRADISSLFNFNVPFLGICEGHEIIGEVFGGNISKLKKKIESFNKIILLKKNKIFKNIPERVEMYESHSRYIKKLPPEFEIAATSEKNKIEALFHKTKPIYGVQFHPEFSGKFGEQIIKNFLEICE